MTQPARIDLCGTLGITVAGKHREGAMRRQSRMLVAYLALHRDRVVSREDLIQAVWGKEARGEHRADLNSLLSKVRSALGDGIVENRGPSLQLAPEVVVDFHETLEQVQEARGALSDGRFDDASAAARAAIVRADLSVLHGESPEWLEDPRRQLAEAGIQARVCLVEIGLAKSGPALDDAIACAREILAAEPFRDSACQLLMRALAAHGDAAEAIAAYEEFRRRLDETLGIYPSEQLRTLHAQLLSEAPIAPTPVASPPAAGGPAGLSPRAATRSQTPFVGRERELELLRSAYGEAARGRCRLVILEGEAGIGKTRLAMTVAQSCAEQGALWLYGRCDAQGAIPYQPFVEALRRHLKPESVQSLQRLMPQHIGELGLMLPELQYLRAATSRQGGYEDTERLRLFDAVSMVVRLLAEEQPVVLVVDDLHWAEMSTLLMMRQLFRLVADASVLIIGTFRGGECTDQFKNVLADMRREDFFDRIPLDGLGPDETAQLINQLDDGGAEPDITHALWEETRGHPFFLEEMLRHRRQSRAAGSGELGTVPQGVKDVIGRRVARLSPAAHDVLEIASVIGMEFSGEVIEHLCDLSEDEVLRVLDEAVDASVIFEVDGTYGRYAFEHALTRQTLLEGLTRTRQARLHLRVGEQLERLGLGEGPAAQLAELSHHFLLAPPSVGHQKALTYAQRAGRHAVEVLAYEEAVREFRLALSLLRPEPADDGQREEMLLELADAQLRAGDTRDARETYQSAATIARRRGSARGLAVAALGACARQVSAGRREIALVGQLEEALRALGDDDHVLRSRLLGRLATELSFIPDQVDRRARLSEEAVALARGSGEADGLRAMALSSALHARHWAVWTPANVHERLRLANEILRLGNDADLPKSRLEGHRWRMMDLLELGRMDDVDSELAAFADLARDRRMPSELWYIHLYRAMQLLFEGRYLDAARESFTGYERGAEVDDPNAHGHTLQMMVLGRDVGRLHEFENAVRSNLDRYTAIPAWQAALGLLLAETGREDEARRAFDTMAADDFAGIPFDALWLGAMVYAAELAHALGDKARAEVLYERLSPFPDRNVVIGFAVACVGSSSRSLALLASTLGRQEEAMQHFERALAMNVAMHAWPFAARTRVEFGTLLLTKPDRGARAVDLLREGLKEAERLGMPAVASRARRLLEAPDHAHVVAT